MSLWVKLVWTLPCLWLDVMIDGNFAHSQEILVISEEDRVQTKESVSVIYWNHAPWCPMCVFYGHHNMSCNHMEACQPQIGEPESFPMVDAHQALIGNLVLLSDVDKNSLEVFSCSRNIQKHDFDNRMQALDPMSMKGYVFQL